MKFQYRASPLVEPRIELRAGEYVPETFVCQSGLFATCSNTLISQKRKQFDWLAVKPEHAIK